ncbi:hypothetical protein LC612_38770, partial [Nostoc sp. CHAB 5834]|nr:hypothetical protein [Nostoc sp. CHAB 5834]
STLQPLADFHLLAAGLNTTAGQESGIVFCSAGFTNAFYRTLIDIYGWLRLPEATMVPARKRLTAGLNVGVAR